jgi:hypothetical protein
MHLQNMLYHVTGAKTAGQLILSIYYLTYDLQYFLVGF